MRVHHLNTGSMLEIEAVDDPSLAPARIVAHTLLIETEAGLVLVESGIGTQDIKYPEVRLGADWIALAAPVLDLEETALHQVIALGYAAEDVRHIVLTHLDRDHAGGLSDFPDALVHVHEAEQREALAFGADRYRKEQIAHGPRWATYASRQGEPWYGFDAVRELDGLPPEILMIPLGGHTEGHVAVAVHTGERWLFHAGDAYFYHREVDPDASRSHPLLDLVQVGGEVDRQLRLGNHARMRELVRLHGDEVDVISAHDPWEFQRHA